MIQTKKFTAAKFFYASPWISASAAGLLALIILVFAINNFQHEKKLMLSGLNQEGRAVLGLVSSASRDSLRRAFMRGEVQPTNMLETVQLAIDAGAEHPNLDSLYLVNEGGTVLAHSKAELIGQEMSAETAGLLAKMQRTRVPDVNAILPGSSSSKNVFIIMAPFHPVGPRFAAPRDSSMQKRRMMGRYMSDRQSAAERQLIVEELERLQLFLVAELGLNDFTSVARKQLIQLVILSAILLLVGAGGILSLMMLQGLRISQSKLARMATFTDVLVSSLPIGLIAIDQRNMIRTCNKSGQEMLELARAEVEGMPAEEILPENVYRILNQRLHAADVHQFEIKSSDLPGKGRSLIITRLAIAGNGKQELGTMLLLQDLSEIRKLEDDLQRIEKDAAVGRMAAGVAHELRNPLSSIKGLALLLKSKAGQEGTEFEAARLLTDEVDRLNRSISELLDYARPARLATEQTSIEQLVSKAVSLIRADAEGAHISIAEQYDASAQTVSVDPDKVTQVILNICLNSIQAMAAGGDMSIISRATELGIEIEIGDSGPGLKPELLEKAFEPYYTTKKDGTGLGLAMSRKIIEDHGGSITLYSTEGAGTTAVIFLPFTQAEL
jgi:two-component system sensor histidine kinase HydH